MTQSRLNADNSYNQIFDYLWLDDTPIAQIKTTYGAGGGRRLTYIPSDHLTTPRLMTDANQTVVWRWMGDGYGLSTPETNPDGDSITDTLDLRMPGQIADSETGLFYNMNRYYDPQTVRYTQSDPIGLAGGLNTYAYVNGNPVSYIDPLGLEAELCTRQFYPVPVPYARHCFVRYNGDDGDTSSYDNKGTHPDPNPKNASCQKTEGDRDDCIKREMQKCKASDYDFSGFNCCHCAEQAMKACGINTSPVKWPNWPVNPGPQPSEK